MSDSMKKISFEELAEMSAEDLIGKAIIPNGLTMEQAQLLAKILEEKFGVKCSVMTAGELADMMEQDQTALKGKEISSIMPQSKYHN